MRGAKSVAVAAEGIKPEQQTAPAKPAAAQNGSNGHHSEPVIKPAAVAPVVKETPAPVAQVRLSKSCYKRCNLINLLIFYRVYWNL